MDFFKYDFKHTCFRLIICLIIGAIWIWFMYKIEDNYKNDPSKKRLFCSKTKNKHKTIKKTENNDENIEIVDRR